MEIGNSPEAAELQEIFMAIEGTIRDEEEIFNNASVKVIIEVLASRIYADESLFEGEAYIDNLMLKLVTEREFVETDGHKGFLIDVVAYRNNQPLSEMQIIVINPLLEEEAQALERVVSIASEENKPENGVWQ